MTTGNELVGDEIKKFSEKLDLDVLYNYSQQVKNTTEAYLKNLSYEDLKRKFDEDDKIRLRNLKVVSIDEKANFLIEYWCDKNVLGLIKMPLSRHWIMHTEASIRIRDKIYRE